MKWECTSTDSPQGVANRFASEAFDKPRQVVPGSYKTIGDSSGLFRVTEDDRPFEVFGVPPGRWTVVSKAIVGQPG